MPLRRETLAQRILDLIFLRLLKLDLTLAYIWVYIKSSLHVQWDVLPCLSNLIGIELPVNCRLLLICLNLHLRHRIRDKTVAIARVSCFGTGRTAESYIELIVRSTSSS